MLSLSILGSKALLPTGRTSGPRRLGVGCVGFHRRLPDRVERLWFPEKFRYDGRRGKSEPFLLYAGGRSRGSFAGLVTDWLRFTA